MTPVKKTRFAVFAVLATAFCVALLGAHKWFETHAIDEMVMRERPILALHTENVRGWLRRFRSLAPTYARNPDVMAAVTTPDDPNTIAAINRRLQRWSDASGAAEIYLLDPTGLVIAASNWDAPISFVGNNYAFRPYFTQAMRAQLGRFFALGIASGKRGYFFSYPVLDDGPALGVIVVKVPVDLIEQELRTSANEVFVTNDAGVIVLAGHPEWRMKTLGPLSESARARIIEERQFEVSALTPVEITGAMEDGAIVRAVPDRSDTMEREFLHIAQPMTVEGWSMHLMIDSTAARAQALTWTLLAGASSLLIAIAGFALWQRRRRFIDRLAERERVQKVLERRVSERTEDLQQINMELAEQVAERAQAEAVLRQTQAELVQAGKLAALGQMSSALSHEFNQPLAAIRTYAENATAFIARGQTERAEENLSRISRLTERMAQLSKHLTAFSRKPKDTIVTVSLKKTLDETLELLRARIEASGVQLTVSGPDDVLVRGGQTRLQHVFMNLIGNGIDAAQECDQAEINVGVATSAEHAIITVEDNGTGIDPADIDKLFDPFFSTKEPGKGLGLGLSISFNIILDFGGSIMAENREEGGARFTVVLNRAQAIAEAAE